MWDVEDGWYNPHGRNTRHNDASIGPRASARALADAESEFGYVANLDAPIGKVEAERMKTINIRRKFMD